MKIGLLGGGQLGRMLIQEAINWNIDIAVLDNDIDAPCKYLTHNFVHGSLTNYDDVFNFGQDLDIITIEIENVNVDALFALEKLGKKIYPQPNVLKIIQDKGLQKMFYHDYKIPTAEFILTESQKDVTDCANVIPFAQKLRKGGYDGKGVLLVNTIDDLKNAFDAPSVLEKKVEIKKELSVIVARNANGEVAVYNSVECVFDPELNLVDTLISPANISLNLEKEAQQMATHIITTLNMVGILAVEFFLTDKDELLVNEIAPRPHNSGHHTIEANCTSQYQQHLRAVLNYPLGSTKQMREAVMINLIGAQNHTGNAVYEGLETVLKMDEVFVHLYGKKTTKPGRKMGHVTITSTNKTNCLVKAQIIKQTLKIIS